MSVLTDTHIEISKLYGSFFHDGDAAEELKTNPSIITRLARLHEQQVRPVSEDKLHRMKQKSQPPGVMHAWLAIDEIECVITGWYYHTTGYEQKAVNIATVLPDRVPESDLPELFHDMKACVRTGLVALDLARQHVNIRGVACPHCGKRTLMYAPDEPNSDVYCGNGGATGCHDDAMHNCFDGKKLTCRRSAGSTRHGLRWPSDQLHELAALTASGTQGSRLGARS